MSMNDVTTLTTYPDDPQFTDYELERVQKLDGGGWDVGFDGGLGFFVPADSPVEPAVGMTMRQYGKGFGYSVRGLFLDGQRVYYRTEAEDKEHQAVQMYGADAADMLAKWDRGDIVHTIEMGGMGPGYEQCIQIMAMEILRHLLGAKYDHSLWQDREVWDTDRDAIDKALRPVVSDLGPSGAQWGAALSLATALYARGPRQCLAEVPKDRHTMASRAYPQAPPPERT